VLIAKRGANLLQGCEEAARQPERSVLSGIANALFGSAGGIGAPALVYEPDSKDEVDIIVVRQQTTRQSGYCTPPAAARTVVEYSLKLAAALLARNRNAA
jgi:hypothetical protein